MSSVESVTPLFTGGGGVAPSLVWGSLFMNSSHCPHCVHIVHTDASLRALSRPLENNNNKKKKLAAVCQKFTVNVLKYQILFCIFLIY